MTAPQPTVAGANGDGIRNLLLALALGALITFVAFTAGGGLQLEPLTVIEILITLVAVLVTAGATLLMPADQPRWGTVSLVALASLVALTTLSITWAIQPSDSWLETNRLIAYTAVFASAIGIARLAPQRWTVVIGATLVSALVISGYALATKVFPDELNPTEIYARLREPFGYWNAVGVMAAVGVPACFWLATRRQLPRALRVAAYPILSVLFITVLFSYSRGTLLATALGLGFWFIYSNRRLHGLSLLLISALGSSVVVAWAFGKTALTNDKVPLVDKVSAGHELGLVLLAALLATTIAAAAIDILSERRQITELTRRRVGIGIGILAVVGVLAGIGALAVSEKGIDGQISSSWESLTSDRASTPSNDPGRLTATSSVRARYWREAVDIWELHPLLGAGADGYATERARFRTSPLEVRHAHGFLVQILADLGLVGLGLCLLFSIAWLFAAVRAMGLRKRVRVELTPVQQAERAGLLAIGSTVLIFAVHSFVDWTWYIPGPSVIALISAGWLAGRGPIKYTPAARPKFTLRDVDPLRIVYAVLVIAIGIAASWSIWQPLRSVDAGNNALDSLEAGNIPAARKSANDAKNYNPLSIEPYFTLAAIDVKSKQPILARDELEQAVRLQPNNAITWERLADYQFNQLHDQKGALKALTAALFLDPRSPTVQAQFLQARLAAAPKPKPKPNPNVKLKTEPKTSTVPTTTQTTTTER